ncbi:PAAR motif family protein [Collimonas arenae]|uniref:PAAR motif family protein n=1 Tax=Collimonas arenae TaxID=279058 RepID=A0A127PMU8_9BURK|nr:PAAR domain-containing protein [Collimonas arenae]AMO99102.1 PAAR motif family protein [Collimonas arenae]AMP09002.1 PAAR motif family protein [Collimonas arenae]
MTDRPICREGDATSHGGQVITASGSMMIDGRRNARVGDAVSCPEHGDNQIVEGCSMLDEGVSVVLHACKTACGSTVIATGSFTVAS